MRLPHPLALAFAVACLVTLPSCSPTNGNAPSTPSQELPPLLQNQPNILWISAEDMGPRLGSYGDAVARTPNIDGLARQGIRYTRAFTAAGVCSPNRSAIITGMHQSSIGGHHMRTLSGAPFAPPPAAYSAVPPHYVKTFTEYLRAAGYYTTNNVKEDYQFETPITAWDESSRTAHWRNRPDPDQPFFAVFNFTTTHESRIWPDPKAAFRAMGLPEHAAHPAPPPLVTDPDAVPVPPYYPDTPVVRRDIAQQYDNIARMDEQVGEILQQLEEDNLVDNTIVFFWSDHGDGLPRMKRWVYDSGLHVPLIVHIPGQGAGVDDQLVSFVDLAPTVLSLAGLEPPVHMQGRAFLGPYQDAKPAHDYVFAARDRFDEQYDLVRAVRDKRFKYIRNYYPEKPYVLWMAYANVMPTMQEMFRLDAEGRLEGPQTLWFRTTRPVHELYDLDADPHEINNLARDPAHRDRLARMQDALDRWMQDINDLGPVSEVDMVEQGWPGGVQPETAAPAIFPRAGMATIFEPDGSVNPAANGGTFDEPVVLTMYSPTQGASIAYTTEEGDNPHWKLFSGPITVRATTTIRAKAIRYGYKESRETVATFTMAPAE